MMKCSLQLLALGMALALAACSGAVGTGQRGTADEVRQLTRALIALGPQVDPAEAARAARVSFQTAQALTLQYQITDPPLVHNSKVNKGIKQRGLCYHWAEDMEARLLQEDFKTLTLHRAIANADRRFRIDHSSAIIGAQGRPMMEGIVIDPWRAGGRLTWLKARDDSFYPWEPRLEVQRRRGRIRYAQPDGSLSPVPAF